MSKKKKIYSEFGFTLQITNNTNATQQLDILGNPANLLDTANATTEYQWNVTGTNPTNFVTLEYMPVGAAAFTVYTASMSSGISGLVAALNGLGIGYFYSSTAGGNTYVSTYNDKYVFGNLTVIQSIQISVYTDSISLSLVATGLSGTIDWGDGTIDSLPAVFHSYSVGDNYTITITYEGTIQGFSISDIASFNTVLPLPNTLQSLTLGDSLNVFNPTIPLPASLVILDLSVNGINNFNPSLPLPAGLQQIYLNLNPLVSGFNPSLPLPAGLQRLSLSNCSLSSFNPSLPLPVGLQRLLLDQNALTSFNPSSLPAGLQTLDLTFNNLLTPDVNTILIYLDSLGYSAPFNCDISNQATPAPPTGLGITAKNNLIGRGCTIITD